ncbi:hypothetical protein [Aliamphritea spongicola]|nr:hypothetical protein [Aliamphritea spongicola]
MDKAAKATGVSKAMLGQIERGIQPDTGNPVENSQWPESLNVRPARPGTQRATHGIQKCRCVTGATYSGPDAGRHPVSV